MGTRDELASRTRADLLAAAKRLFGERQLTEASSVIR